MTPSAPRSRDLAPKFWCLTCQAVTASRVLETRGCRRRRMCLDCRGTFPTLEVLLPTVDAPKHRPASTQGALPFDARDAISGVDAGAGTGHNL